MSENEQIAKALAELSSAVKEQKEKGADPVLQEKIDRIASEVSDLGKKVENITNAATLELDDEPDEVTLPYKDLFNTESGSKIAKLYGFAPDPISTQLYRSRTVWSKKDGWKRTGSYDGLEHLMELNDNIVLSALTMAHQRHGVKNTNDARYLDLAKKTSSYQLFQSELAQHTELRKALDTGDTGNFVPTQFSAQLMDDVRLQIKVAGLFRRLSLTKSPFTNPVRGSRVPAYLVGESTSDVSDKIPTSNPGDQNVTFAAIKFAVRNVFSDELEEDSIVPILPWVRDELIQAMADAEEDCIINGDTTATHMDSDTTSVYDVKKGFKGLRKLSGLNSGNAAVDLGTFSTANLRAIRKAMGKYGVNPADLAYVVSMSAYIDFLGLSEVLTLDKYGAQATVMNGELAKFDGIPIVVSEFMRQDLNASGVYDGSTTDNTALLLVYRPSFIAADFGVPKSETDRDIETQQTKVVTSHRMDFERVHTPGTGEQNIGYGYNIAA